MELAIITQENVFDNEPDILNMLFDAGLPLLHLRKPNITKEKMRELVEGIDPIYYDRIVMHDHFELINSYKLKGVHLNGRNPEKPQYHNSSISRSCHSLEELQRYRSEYDYMFLSPVFDSISKAGYYGNFRAESLNDAALKGIINKKIFALGGVSEKTIPLAVEYGFGGVAVLGALWGRYSTDGDYKSLKTRLLKLLDVTGRL